MEAPKKSTSTPEQVREKLNAMSKKEFIAVAKGSSIPIGKRTREELTENLLLAREAAEAIGGKYKTNLELAAALESGEINAERAVKWTKAIRPSNQAKYSAANTSMIAGALMSWGNTSGAFKMDVGKVTPQKPQQKEKATHTLESIKEEFRTEGVPDSYIETGVEAFNQNKVSAGTLTAMIEKASIEVGKNKSAVARVEKSKAKVARGRSKNAKTELAAAKKAVKENTVTTAYLGMNAKKIWDALEDTKDPFLSKRAIHPIERTGEIENALTQMGDELTVGGGIELIGRETGAITGRTKSINPSWAQSLMSDTGATVKEIWNAIDKYKAGRPLGVRQQSIIEMMLAQYEGDKKAGGGFAKDVKDITPPKDDFEIPFMSKKAEPKKHVRRKLDKTKDGRYIGVPIWVEKAADVTKLRKLLRQLATEGEVGRMWYENSSKMIMRLTSGNKVDAEIIAQLIAIYSPQNSIFPNMTQAIQAYYQFKSGVKAEDFVVRPMGQKKDGVLVNTLDHKAVDLLYNNKPWVGRKTNSFYENLMVDIEHTGVHSVTVDMWMSRAFGYLNDGIASGIKEGSGIYSFIENEVTDIANEYGWTPHQAQAAIWVAIKGRHEIPSVKEATIKESVKKGFSEYGVNGKWKAPTSTKKGQEHRKIWRKHALKASLTQAHLESSKYDFHDALRDMYGQVSWEARPSTDTNILKGIQDAPLEQHIEYQTAMGKALTDEKGNDIIAEKIGMLTDEELVGAGVWDGFTGAGAQRTVVIPQKRKKATKEAAASPAAAKILNLYSDIKGYILSQDGVSWHRPFYTTTIKDSNGMDFQLGRPITYEEATAVANIVNETIDKDVVPIPTEKGVRFLNFTIVDNKDFHVKIVEAMGSVFAGSDITIEARRFGSDGELRTNDWTENANGENYRQRILEEGGRSLLEWVDSELAQRVERVDKQFESKYGWKTTRPTSEKIGSVTSPISLHRLEDSVAVQREIYGRFGKFTNKDTTESLKFYNLNKIIKDPSLVDDMLTKYGYNVKYFSFDPANWKLPKLKKDGYQQGTLWIYDPAIEHGSFKDTEYTRQWRIVHELGHGITERIIQERYGDSRREGRMGREWGAQRGNPNKKVVTVQLEPLTLMQSQRAVEWEDVAFRVQRMLFKQLGINASPEVFGKEYNNNVADAIHRTLTGDFADAGITGFVPHGTLPQVKSILTLLQNQETAMAKEQGRKPSKGIDLKSYKRFTEAELQELISEQVTVDPMMSRQAIGDTRMGKEELQVYVDELSRDWKNAPPITAVGSAAELPAHLYDFVKSENAEGEVDGIYDTATGQVFLIADGITDANHATRVVFHEVMGHAGIKGLFGSEASSFLKELFDAKRNEMNEVGRMYNLDFTKVRDRLVAAEEWLAMEAENAPRSTWVQRFISFVRQALRRMFGRHGRAFKVTNAEVLGALGRMRQVIRDGDKIGDLMARTHPLLAKAKPTFYSQLERVLSDKLPNKGTGQSYINAINAYVRKGQIKIEEVEWSGVTDWLHNLGSSKIDALNESFTKQQVLDFVAENKIDVQEEILGEPDAGVSLNFEEVDVKDWFYGHDDVEVNKVYEDDEVGFVIRDTAQGFFVEDPTGLQVDFAGPELNHYNAYEKYEDAVDAANRELNENNDFTITDGPKHRQYTLEGGKNYRELILTLPDQIKPYKPDAIHFTEEGGGTAVAWIRFKEREGANGERVMFIEEIQSKRHMDAKKKGYKKEGDEPSVLQELSDSFDNPPSIGHPDGVPDAPFKKNWRMLAIKRAIRYAAENGFDTIAWTTGEQQAERYDLSKEVSKIAWARHVVTQRKLVTIKLHDGKAHQFLVEKDGKVNNAKDMKGLEFDGEKIENILGKGLAEKVMEGDISGEIIGPDLKVGGEGLKTLYDKIIPKEIGKYVKKWGSKVSTTKLETTSGTQRPATGEWQAAGYETNPFGIQVNMDDTEFSVLKDGVAVAEFNNRGDAIDYIDKKIAEIMKTEQQSIDITEEMRDSVMQGQPMFSRGQRETAAATEEVRQSLWEAYKTRARAVIAKLDNAIDGFGHLEDIVKYREARGITQANIHKSQEVAKRIYNVFKDLSATDARNVFEYMTDRDASEGLIPDPRIRAEAMRAKNMISTIGRMLVERGVIPASSQQLYNDRYLPRLYLAYLLGDKAVSALGGGKKLSKQGYAMHRDEKLSKEYREVVLGEIKDPAFLASRAIGVPARDLAIMDFFDDILENPAWSLPDQTIKYKIAGTNKERNVTAFWLQKEAARMRDMAMIMKEGEQKSKVMKIAEQYDMKSREILPREYDHNEWKQLPDTPQYGVLRGLIVRKAIYDDLLGVAHAVPENDLNAWQRLFNYGSTGTKITQAWKTTKVALNPPSQIRNLVSNWVLLNISGVRLDLMPFYLAKAAREIATGGKYYKIAEKYGVTAGTFTAHELLAVEREFLDFKARNIGKFSITGLMHLASGITNKAGDIYQLAEVLSKVAKIAYEVERNNMEPAVAAQEANKWLFDYSAVNPTIRTIRNAPVGSPFLTFYMKVLPRLLETAATAPWRFAPYYILLKGLSMAVAAINDVDDEDVESLKMALPKWLRERGHAMILPWKDAEGRWQAFNMGYFFPWTAWTDLAEDAGGLVDPDEADAGRNLIQGTGLFGGPIPQLMGAMMTNIDPFTRKEIVNEGDLPSKQVYDRMNFVYSLMVPPWMTSKGPLGKMWKAGTGFEDKWGNPQPTLPQATMRWLGVNIYPIEAERSRKTNLKFMQRDMQDKKTSMRRELSNPNLSPDEKRDLRKSYKEEIKRMQGRMKAYKEESEIHPNLKN